MISGCGEGNQNERRNIPGSQGQPVDPVAKKQGQGGRLQKLSGQPLGPTMVLASRNQDSSNHE